MAEFVLGDPFGIHLRDGWGYLSYPDVIYVKGLRKTTFQKTIIALTHETIHSVLCKILDTKMSQKANEGFEGVDIT